MPGGLGHVEHLDCPVDRIGGADRPGVLRAGHHRRSPVGQHRDGRIPAPVRHVVVVLERDGRRVEQVNCLSLVAVAADDHQPAVRQQHVPRAEQMVLGRRAGGGARLGVDHERTGSGPIPRSPNPKQNARPSDSVETWIADGPLGLKATSQRPNVAGSRTGLRHATPGPCHVHPPPAGTAK